MPEIWTIGKVLGFAVPFFAGKNLPNPRLDAEVLLAYVLRNDRIFLYSHYDTPLSSEELACYRAVIMRRAQGEPVAYITGFKEFMSLNFAVSPQVLIPRPDTETLVVAAIELAGSQQLRMIADVGTGSGAIAISVAHYTQDLNTQVWATDCSAEALAVARKNAQDLGADVCFSQGNLLAPLLQDNIQLDLLLANLPYIPAGDAAALPPDVRDFEPPLALFAGADGLDCYRELLPMAVEILKPGGFMLWEIDDSQADPVSALVAPQFPAPEIIRDLAGRRRVLKARKG